MSFAVRRAAAAGVVLLTLSAIVFALEDISPGDPARAYLGGNASPAAVAAERRTLRLDDPLIARFGHFLSGIFHGSLGVSYRTHRPVTSDLAAFLLASIELVLVAFLLAIVLGGTYAVTAALRLPGSGLLRGLLLTAATAPPFLLALGGIIVFYADLGWLPASGRGPQQETQSGFTIVDAVLHAAPGQLVTALRYALMPALVLSIAPAIAVGRVLRSSLEQTLRADHVRTARSKGLAERAVLFRHVLRNSLGPALSMAGLQLGFMFGGVVIVEQIFSWPGIGNYLAESLPVSDFSAIAGVTLVLGAVYVLANAVVDVLQALADPRITL